MGPTEAKIRLSAIQTYLSFIKDNGITEKSRCGKLLSSFEKEIVDAIIQDLNLEND